MSSVSGKLDADFDISTSSPTQCFNGLKHSSLAGSEESQESDDGDETGYINQTENEESVTKDLGKSTLESLPALKSSINEDKDENITIIPVVLIPAIKGSREKHGLSLKKSSVSWADDVYDPPPSIASHTKNKEKQQHKSKSKDNHKKTGKKGQKNSSSRSGKDKKQSTRKKSREKFDWATQMPIVAASS